MGQGSDTAYALMVAEVLDMDANAIRIVHPDTDVTLLAEQYITVTPLQFNLTHEAMLREMGSWQWKMGS